MARKLDILVPVYDEGVEVLTPLLRSIELQVGVDFSQIGVIVCCDGGSTVLTDEYMAQFPFHVEFHMCEHRGVSATRNACLDHSDAEYVSWSDCDDRYCDVCGLYIVFQQMEKGFQLLISNFREQTKGPDGKFVFVDHGIDSTFVHGKVANRQFLIDHDIRWNPELRIHEDSFFNVLCKEIADPDRSVYCPHPFYLWTWRDESVARHDKKYILKTYVDMVKSNDALVDEFIRRMMLDKASYYVGFLTFDAFYTMNKQEWVDTVNAEYREKTERRFAEYFRKHKEQWDVLTPQEKVAISNGVRQRSVSEGMLLEALTVDQWLERVLSKY
jgi:glycosyltransferase involved in cell wall biosynthesis